MLVGISMVRNEEDIVATTLRHHLRQGVELLLVADNDSTDGTRSVLARLAREDRRIRWTATGDTGFRQSEVVTELADTARLAGATWVLPFDADEFWWARGGLPAALRGHGADAVSVGVVNFVQGRAVLRAEPGSILSAVYRPAATFGDYRHARIGVEAGEFSYVEAPYQRKYVVRAVAGLPIGPGAHLVAGAKRRSRSSRLVCLHVPLRARDVFHEKAKQSDRLVAAGLPFWHGWQSHRFAKAVREGWMDAEWAANSHADGCLDAARGKVRLIHDPTIADLLRPHLS